MNSRDATQLTPPATSSADHAIDRPDAETDTSRLWAGAALSVPLLVLAVAAMGLLTKAPGHVATRWTAVAGAGPDGFDSAAGLLVRVGIVTLLFTVLGLGAVMIVRDVSSAARIVLVTTAVAAASAAVWVTSVVLSMTADDVEVLRVESGTLPIIVSMLWAVVPFAVLRVRARQAGAQSA